MKGAETLFSSINHGWGTPRSLFDELRKEFDIQLDACTSVDNPLDTPFYYSLTNGDDGLKQKWLTWTFCNPPYNATEKWIKKADEEACYNHVNSILLLPARTDTKWFHTWLWNDLYHKPFINTQIRFLKGRLKFYGAKNSAPFPSMLVIFDNKS